jgi:hypothetical protein
LTHRVIKSPFFFRNFTSLRQLLLSLPGALRSIPGAALGMTGLQLVSNELPGETRAQPFLDDAIKKFSTHKIADFRASFCQQ